MAKRGRKPLLDPPVDLWVSLPRSLVAKIEIILYDPTTGKSTYGSRSRLFQLLLKQWLEKGAPSLTREGEEGIMPDENSTEGSSP